MCSRNRHRKTVHKHKHVQRFEVENGLKNKRGKQAILHDRSEKERREVGIGG